MPYRHVPVMLEEVLAYLDCRPGKRYADCTLGGSGHARGICERISPDGLLIGIDQDPDAVANAREVLRGFQACSRLFCGNFVELPDYLDDLRISALDGILLDLGISLHQLEGSGKGFSFQRDEPLDMRMGRSGETTAATIINTASEEELRRIFKTYGEEPRAARIARKIAAARRRGVIRTSGQLAGIVARAVGGRAGSGRLHPATKVFMGLRIAVNRELERLETFMQRVDELLNPGGRLCVLAFHSLEDRIVKQRLRVLAKGCHCPPDFPQCVCGAQPAVRILTPKVVKPSRAEVLQNPMARSCRLRAAEKL
jgi:16S rRNA (cytosine1402-N4)-methyltransferase